MVELVRVDARLVEASLASAAAVADLLVGLGVDAEVRPFGSSIHLGSLSKGDVDVLVRVAADDLAALVAALDGHLARAQEANWDPDFASFSGPVGEHPSVGVQVVVVGSALDRQLLAQAAALEDPDVRAQYDRAKLEGSTLGPDGYWQVKDRFWRDLRQPEAG